MDYQVVLFYVSDTSNSVDMMRNRKLEVKDNKSCLNTNFYGLVFKKITNFLDLKVKYIIRLLFFSDQKGSKKELGYTIN